MQKEFEINQQPWDSKEISFAMQTFTLKVRPKSIELKVTDN